MRLILINLLFICNIYLSCDQLGKSQNKIEIEPLHPYSLSPTSFTQTLNKENLFVVKYFYIDSQNLDQATIFSLTKNYLKKYLKEDPEDFESYGGYYVYFFRKTGVLNAQYRSKGDDNNPESYIDSDLLLQYVWGSHTFRGCEVYNSGKVKTILFDEKDSLFKK